MRRLAGMRSAATSPTRRKRRGRDVGLRGARGCRRAWRVPVTRPAPRARPRRHSDRASDRQRCDRSCVAMEAASDPARAGMSTRSSLANERGQRVAPRTRSSTTSAPSPTSRATHVHRLGVGPSTSAATRRGGCDRSHGDGEIALAAVCGEIVGGRARGRRADRSPRAAEHGQHRNVGERDEVDVLSAEHDVRGDRGAPPAGDHERDPVLGDDGRRAPRPRTASMRTTDERLGPETERPGARPPRPARAPPRAGRPRSAATAPTSTVPPFAIARRAASSTTAGSSTTSTGTKTVSASRSPWTAGGSIRRAALRVTMLETSTVTSTTTSVAFRRSVSKRPISTPIVTAASVAAACASERPKSKRRLRPREPEHARRESCRRGLSDEDDRKRQARDREHAHAR